MLKIHNYWRWKEEETPRVFANKIKLTTEAGRSLDILEVLIDVDRRGGRLLFLHRAEQLCYLQQIDF